MEAPIERLPPELLAMSFERLTFDYLWMLPAQRALCAMTCKRWQALTNTLWPEFRTTLDNLLCWAALQGNLSLMKAAKGWGAQPSRQALLFAAEGGNVACLKLLKNWGEFNKEDFCLVLRDAAYAGHIECLKLAKEWGATTFDVGIWFAAEGGHANCMKITRLLKQWKAEA